MSNPEYPDRAGQARDVIYAAEAMEIAYAQRGIPTGELYRSVAESKWQAARAAFREAVDRLAKPALSRSEQATVLAALRYFQAHGQGDPDNRDAHIHDIATHGGEEVSLDSDGIDELAARCFGGA